jgi:hypothetical protein
MFKLLLLPAILVPDRFKKYRLVILYGCVLLVLLELACLLGIIYYVHRHPDVALEQTIKNWVRMLK